MEENRAKEVEGVSGEREAAAGRSAGAVLLMKVTSGHFPASCLKNMAGRCRN